MNQRGQGLSFFILLGFIMAALMLFWLVLGIQSADLPTVTTENGLELRSFVQSCVEDVSTKGVFVLGRQGGYTREPSPHQWETYGRIGFGFQSGKNTFVTRETMEEELGAYIQEKVPECVNSFEAFKEQGIVAQESHVESDVLLSAKDVRISLDFPIKIQEQGVRKTLNDFHTVVPVRLALLQNTINGLFIEMEENDGFIDLTYIDQGEFDVLIITDVTGNNILAFEDKDSKLGKDPYVFLTAIRGAP